MNLRWSSLSDTLESRRVFFAIKLAATIIITLILT